MSRELERAREAIAAADGIVVLTGSGISAESGVPTFRDAGGLWRSYRPEDLATPEAFARAPGDVWAWYHQRRSQLAGCRPNAGHRALARLALGRPGVTLVTQNVDGLHHEAARIEARSKDPSPAFPFELHGALHRDRCSRCARRTPAVTELRGEELEDLPRCEDCGALLRPDVVWFGEMLDVDTLERSFAAARAADLCLVVGTSAVVHPAASVPFATMAAGGRVIEVNLERTPLSSGAHATVLGPASRILPDLLSAWGASAQDP